jgi:hypothetical protein
MRRALEVAHPSWSPQIQTEEGVLVESTLVP